jgi:predicted  nucleic acid-binding Zn-ribbon protein
VSASELAALLAVQDLDTSMDQHRHRRRNLPEREQLAALEAESQAVGAEAGRLGEQRDAVAEREAEVEAELAATEQRAAAVSRRLYGGEVSASRELQAMAADVENLRARASELEDQGLVLLEEREPLDNRMGELESQLSELDSRRRDVADTVARAEAVIDEEIAELEKDRQTAASVVPADLLATYERLRARLGGIGAARLIGNRCDGCHLALPAVELDRIRRLAPGQVVTCEQCSRILVPQ